jgi:hypothetical protein
MGNSFPTEVGPQDTVVLHVTGVKPGAAGRGLPTAIVQQTILLKELLANYGEAPADPATVDMEALSALAEKDAAAFQAEWAKLGQSMSVNKTEALPDRVIAAVCAFLEKEHDVLVSEKDPGTDKWYVNPADFQPVVQKHQADGYQWFISLAAPFG